MGIQQIESGGAQTLSNIKRRLPGNNGASTEKIGCDCTDCGIWETSTLGHCRGEKSKGCELDMQTQGELSKRRVVFAPGDLMFFPEPLDEEDVGAQNSTRKKGLTRPLDSP